MHAQVSIAPFPPFPPLRSGSRHIPSLQGLRGVAFLGVLLFHTGALSGGFLGVDLFFVLSGYLITGLLLREVSASRTIALVAFWGRRCRRLLPALVLVLVVVTLAVWISGSVDLLRTTLSDGPWVQASMINWHLLAESASYWDEFGDARVFEHLWSIAVEEQFYLIWPFVVLAIARWSRRPEVVVLVIAVVGALISMLLMICLTDPGDPTRVYTGTDTRAFALLLGAAAVTAPVRRAVKALVDRMNAVGNDVLLGILLTGLLAAWVLVDGTDSQWLYTGGLVAHSAAAALVIVLLEHTGRRGVGRVLSFAPVRWVGDLSYSLYLWHWPIIILLSSAAFGLVGWSLTVVAAALSLVASLVSKVLVEDPVRHRARWARGRSGALALVLLMVALAVFWLMIPQPEASLIHLERLR